jgi:SpoVK/Ycf46/Vps4 family AAA+-type ATPase
VVEGAVDDVSSSHPIALDRIDAAVTRVATEAASHARTSADLRSAARAVARHRLDGLAGRVRGGRSWDDLVLPAHTLRQLREIAAAISHRPRVLDDWGFAARANGGRGMHVLFSGPSGTGKTLAASVIADESGYELYAVDLARVVDKYLGETEKHLDRIFGEASDAGAVLLFDEADALFGQRAEVHDARDRYANVEIAYLLQRLEAHEGVTILATNLGHHLDKAFARRLHHRVEFVVPDAALRRRLWRVVLPLKAPLDDDLDLDLVAERFELAGGAIRNAALTAAYLAAAAGRPIALRDAVRAVARELEKSGTAATRAEFRELYDLLEPDAAED